MGALQADPSGPLYRVAAGARPLLSGGRGYDLVHLVGLHAAVGRLEADAAPAARLAGRLRSYASVRLAEEGRRVRLNVCAAPDRDREAARRFFGSGEVTPDHDSFPLPRAIAFEGVETRFDPVIECLTLRFARDAAPAPEELFDALCLLARDPKVGSLRLLPWPDRSVRSAGTDL
jgi:hypothetical protein